ncbi:sugar transferase [Microcella alkalica]|uniref:Exopolysaccharide biosynthesis polyprenyl glycosylphosphotransferase n=1 Tax=Microcella alkalica TaxID=355930 RepID=A0A839E6S3_9MICO|nr:sugar transferase [Microcella alkalica]MBA8848161.1 exopolysaccharide biosynthesis polyprenyl glycosylphosphotransferase [Microcella alkalica]
MSAPRDTAAPSTGTHAAPSSGRPADGHEWARRYARRLIATDLLAVAWAVIGTQLLWFGFERAELATREEQRDMSIDYTSISIVLIAAWMAVLAMFGTRDPRIVGTGSIEYKRIADAAFRLFGIVAIIAFLFQLDLARGYILIGFPLGLIALLASRWIWRQWLIAERAHGRYTARAVIVGTPRSATALAAELASKPEAGFRVVGACLLGAADTRSAPWDPPLPTGAGLESLEKLLESTDADTVVVTSTDELPADRMRELSWSLEPGRHHLVVAPNLADIAGPRIHMRPVAGLPLMHIEMPRYEGAQRFSKKAFDFVGALVIVASLSPLLAAIAIVVKLSSPGPVLYRQERIGRDGEAFPMFKFRSMKVDADSELERLLREQGTGDTPLFKVRDDPRVTKVGRVLRRYSLDELPQLFNVLRGEMSLVGPRPQREAEVALYDAAAARRLNVLPGLTGLWQVSGRSNLSWEQAIRLDLYYVENWSMTGDLVILWRTLRAVVRSEGAF